MCKQHPEGSETGNPGRPTRGLRSHQGWALPRPARSPDSGAPCGSGRCGRSQFPSASWSVTALRSRAWAWGQRQVTLQDPPQAEGSAIVPWGLVATQGWDGAREPQPRRGCPAAHISSSTGSDTHSPGPHPRAPPPPGLTPTVQDLIPGPALPPPGLHPGLHPAVLLEGQQASQGTSGSSAS